MFVERLLQILVASMVVLGTTLFGLGQQKAAVACAAPLVAAAAFYLTDVSRRLRLGNLASGLLCVVALLASSQGFLKDDNHLKWLTMVNLLAVFQFVLLFQAKTTRVYWQLIVLSFAQVAAALALSGGIGFGLLLLSYMLLGTMTLSLLLIYQVMTNVDAQLAADRLSEGQREAAAAAAPRRWPLAGSAVQLSGGRGDIAPGELLRGLLSQSTLILTGSLTVAAIVFFLLPRSGRRWEQSPQITSGPQFVGFNKTVNLGQFDEASEDHNLVLRAQFFDGDSDVPLRLEKDPLLRGTVVTNYARGHWKQDVVGEAAPLPIRKPPTYVRQQFVIEPMRDPVLFAVFPSFLLEQDTRLRFDLAYKELVRQRDMKSQRFEYQLGTTGIRNGAQLPVFPSLRPLRRWEEQMLLQMPGPDGKGGRDPLAGLRLLAQDVVTRSGVSPDDHFAVARALEGYLQNSRRFSYSIAPVVRNPKLDPLEDFVLEHPAGHCEYFAGTLAMMLRSQGIPCRVAIGFRASFWNDVGQYYQVRQDNAHSWVEAYLSPSDRLPAPLQDAVDGSRGSWLTLDPTAASTTESLGPAGEQQANLLRRLSSMSDYAFVLWMKYVVELSPETQRQAIYEPLRAIGSLLRKGPFDAEAWRDLWDTFSGWLRQNWFSWRGAVAGSLACLLALGLGRVLSLVLRRLWRHVVAPTARAVLARSPTHEFHRRLEKALGQRGWVRKPGQTALEFAVAAGGELAEIVECRRFAPLPRRVVESLYRVRFGARSLDSAEAEAVEHALVELEQGLERSETRK